MLSRLSAARVKSLVTQVVAQCVDGSFDYDTVTADVAASADVDSGGGGGAGVSEVKGSVAAVHFMVTSAAKHDVDESSLVQEIQQLGLPKESADVVGRHYRDNKDALRTQLADESFRLSRVVGVDWRVDAVLAVSSSSPSSSVGDDSGAVVHLRLRTDTRPHLRAPNENDDATAVAAASVDGGRFRDVAFELSPEKLDVLIHELSHAQALMGALKN